MKPVRFLSLGCGRQSSALFLLSLSGAVPPFDYVLFADTGDESKATYALLALLQQIARGHNQEIEVVRGGRKGSTLPLSEEVLKAVTTGASRVDNPPFYTLGEDGKASPMWQKCTAAKKAKPIEDRMRAILGKNKKPGSATQSRGITVDEVPRVKPSGVLWYETRYELCFDLGWRADDCDRYLRDDWGINAAKSACWHCPWRSKSRWLAMRRDEPIEFAKAVEFESKITHGPMPGSTNERFYLTSSLVPLGQAVEEFSKQRDLFDDPGGWGSECGGLCNV